MTSKGLARRALAFASAVLATAALGSAVQTQINLAPIVAMGAPVTAALRAATTAEDLVRFGPVMAAIAAAAFLPAFAAAWFASRALPSVPGPAVFALAGVAGLWAAFALMGFFTPMPTLVAAVRGAAGLAAMSATGLAGGLVFAVLARPPSAASRVP
mgnify:CR=1 FL=1